MRSDDYIDTENQKSLNLFILKMILGGTPELNENGQSIFSGFCFCSFCFGVEKFGIFWGPGFEYRFLGYSKQS